MNSEIPTSRVYIHARCGEPTEVSGPEFTALADPLAGMEWTVCANCQENDTLEEFAWADTGESIAAYYARHLQAVPAEERLAATRGNLLRYLILAAMIGLLISVALGVGIGQLVGTLVGILCSVVAALLLIPLMGLLGFQYFEKNVVRPIIRRAFQVEDVRQLR